MIGNDIVDLKQAAKESNWQRSRFLDKVFTKQEHHYISASRQQELFVWLLWSMKEAAYKAYVQQFEVRFFSPKKIACTLTSNSTGIVSINEMTYKTTSTITEDYIYTIAIIKETDTVTNFCFEMESMAYKVQSKTVKSQFLEHFAKTNKESLNKLSLTKNNVGIPQLFKDGIRVDLSLSFTHHGVFCGYGYCF